MAYKEDTCIWDSELDQDKDNSAAPCLGRQQTKVDGGETGPLWTAVRGAKWRICSEKHKRSSRASERKSLYGPAIPLRGIYIKGLEVGISESFFYSHAHWGIIHSIMSVDRWLDE